MRKSMPRVQMSLMVCATGTSAFLFSAFLLKMGITQMHIRYLLATIFAYIIFLLFIWLWIKYYRRKVSVVERNNDIDITDAIDIANLDPALMDAGFKTHVNFLDGGSSGGGGASRSFISNRPSLIDTSGSNSSSLLPDLDFDLGEAFVIIILIAAIFAALFSGLYIIYSAPALLSEVLLDGVLSYGLYHKLTKLEQDNWLESVVKRTIIPFAITGIFFFVAGFVVVHYLPGCDSIGDVIAHFEKK